MTVSLTENREGSSSNSRQSCCVHNSTDIDEGNNNDNNSNNNNNHHTCCQEMKDRIDTEWPERQESCFRSTFQSWTFSYMNPILQKGRRQFKDGEHLALVDLFPVPDVMEADCLVESFWRHYREHKHGLLRSLWKTAAPTSIPAALWELLYVAARVSLPLSLRELLIIIETAPPGTSIFHEAWPYVLSLTAAGVFGALAQNRTVFLCTQSGITIRATLTSAIYEHALHLSPKGRKGLTTGEVTNLVAVDTQKLYDVLLEIQNVWSCPLLIFVVTALLWIILGPELVVGVVMLILFLPVIKTIVSTMLRVRKERSKMTDVRINLLTAMLQGIQVTKLNHYERMVETSVAKVRNREMKLLRTELRMWGLVLTMAVCSPLIAFGVAVTVHVLLDPTNVMKPSDAFSAILLFSILRFPINMTARLVGKAAQALDSLKRVDGFLMRETREPKEEAVEKAALGDPDEPVLTVDNGCFVVDSTDPILETRRSSHAGGDDADDNQGTEESPESYVSNFALQEISLSVKRGQLVAVVGQVGSGKTMLLRALLGEIAAADDSYMELRGKISYASQRPFILNATVKENILFGSPYDEKRYEGAMDACCLRSDIQRLGDTGDLTEIGERGVTLSGGQKQRLALCRAIYANPDLALLDDCFSALDSNTGRLVFDRLFSVENEGMLRKSGTVLVTHALHLLPAADLILVMKEGSPAFMGTWGELQKVENTDRISTAMRKSLNDDNEKSRQGIGKLRRDGVDEKDGVIMTVEEREYGVASFYVWVLWFKHAGGWTFFLSQILLLCLDRGFYVASDWWIAIWSENATDGSTILGIEFPPQTDGLTAQSKYVSVYAIIITLSVIATLFRSLWAVSGGARCANTMFKAMTKRVLRAPMSYFETTPLGRIINRFTYDVEVLDIELSVSMTGLMISWSWLMSSIVVMLAVLPWCAFALIPVCAVYYNIQLFYRTSGPDLQRIDATSRSPLQATLAEGLEGLTIIRAFQKQRKFSNAFRQLVNKNSSAMMNFLAAQRWLGLRIEILSSTMSFTTSLLVVCANEVLEIPAGLVGLLIQWSVIFTAALNFFFLRLSESEARLTSIERIQKTTELQQEASWETDPSITQLVPSWPSRGELEFDHVSMRYRKELPLALESVSFKLSPGSRCGVVGRTGAGKTSLTACLFRVVEIEAGRIMLDGVDLAKIGLTDLRGRSNGMRIIPQDPVLYSGTLRDCLDPFQQCEDDNKILEALQAVKHKGAVERGLSVLGELVEEGGSNLSVGERQLLCLARAIVEEPRVLVLDEATASIDTETDTFIQKMLRSRFQNTTLLTIAHRLHTIVDYDNVLVLDDGKVAEFGPPHELLEDTDGVFSSLVDSSGPEASAELRSVANEKTTSL